MFHTSELARLLGVGRSFLHYYDREGIITPMKNQHNYRSYTEADLIALASAKYYRAMNMDLEALKGIVHTSGYKEKVLEMEALQDQLKEQIDFLQDALVVTAYAKGIFDLAYRDESCSVGPGTVCDFLPMVINGEINNEVVDDPVMQNLLQQFPFISYSYRFPENALLKKEDFSYALGVSTIHDMVVKRRIEIPQQAEAVQMEKCIFYRMAKDCNAGFTYEDFEEVRTYAQQQGLTLTGEAVAYCVFSNYEFEKGIIRFVVQVRIL